MPGNSFDLPYMKPPRKGREKPWHQDSAYFNITPASLICEVRKTAAPAG
ncbi:MAG: hypothetical protein QGF67_02275 [Lentisphaeria bacterium]|nr:hypothetical protein [Lentisphaeria bacterium]MDP7740238.1 hypothetical protein [Lentisphaeria bacterium]